MTPARSDRRKNRHFADYLSHIIIIGIIFILPELVMAIAMPHRHGAAFFPGFYLKTVVYIAVFYLNYFLIIDRTIIGGGKKRIGSLLLWNCLVIIVGAAACWLISKHYGGMRQRIRHPQEIVWWQQMLKNISFILRDMVMIILTISLAVALRLSAKWKDLKQQHREILAEQRVTELNNLKSQLNPHFLFNTLNTIYALIAIDTVRAQEAVHTLSSLLRHMLYEGDSHVELEREASFIDDYIDLMRQRMGARPIIFDVDLKDKNKTLVPPLLFIPLVENAFKYGHSADAESPIKLSMKVDDNKLSCTAVNSFTAGGNDDGERRANSGIGLANLRRRLSLLYDRRAALHTKIDGNTFTAKMTIPLD